MLADFLCPLEDFRCFGQTSSFIVLSHPEEFILLAFFRGAKMCDRCFDHIHSSLLFQPQTARFLKSSAGFGFESTDIKHDFSITSHPTVLSNLTPKKSCISPPFSTPPLSRFEKTIRCRQLASPLFRSWHCGSWRHLQHFRWVFPCDSNYPRADV